MVQYKRPPLTKKRQEWAQNRNGVFRGKPLNVNRAAEQRYQRKIDLMVSSMIKDVERDLRRLYNKPEGKKLSAQDASFSSMARILLNKLSNRFQSWFDSNAADISTEWIKNVSKASTTSLHSSLQDATGGLSLKTSGTSQRVQDIIKASVTSNVALIKSIPATYFERITGAVMRSIQDGGTGTQGVFQEISRYGVVTKKRSSLIARDQTSKATTAVNTARMRDLGITKFEWLHSGGGKAPRPLHVSYNGQIFDLNNPPIIDERTGERGMPGQLINCRCRAVPVIAYGNDDDE